MRARTAACMCLFLLPAIGAAPAGAQGTQRIGVRPDERMGARVALDEAVLLQLDRSIAEQQPYVTNDQDRVQPLPPGGTALGIRLGEGLDDYLPQVRQALAALDFVQVDEQSEFELTTFADQPLTLVLRDLRRINEQLVMDWSEPDPFEDPRVVELGNLEAGDYALNLGDALRRIARGKALLGAARNMSPAATRTCFATGWSSNWMYSSCSRGDFASPDANDPWSRYASWISPSGLLRYSVLNRSDRPKYIALVMIDPITGAVRLPLEGDGRPVPPGHWVFGGLDTQFDLGAVHILTIAGDEPIAADDLGPAGPAIQPGISCDPASPPGTCRPPVIASGRFDRWSVSHKVFIVLPEPQPAMGGGMNARAGMAPFAVQIYSTFPYSSEEIAADLAKPRAERKFLVARSAAERDHICGGTLIAQDIVLTAAHCVAKPPFTGAGATLVFKRRRVRLATQRLGAGGTTLAVDGVAVHADYVPGESHDDIALVLLKPDRATYRTKFAPLALPRAGRSGQVPARAELIAFGWGVTGQVASGANWTQTTQDRVNHNPDILQFGAMEKVAWDECRRKMGSQLGRRMLCAGPPNGRRGANNENNVFTCVGDSGGPLVQYRGDNATIVGVVGWSRGCGYQQYDSVFTDVAAYRAWIDKARASLKQSPGKVVRVAER
jgi:secreted trypsin-like serine protease